MRIRPLEAPFEDPAARILKSMMPPGVPPIALFRTFAINGAMAEAMHGWGSYMLSKRLSVDLRAREIVIDRVCARCRCEYEWGVHVAFFAERAELTRDQLRSLTHGTATDPCWPNEHDRVLIGLADSLHDTSTLDDAQWSAVRRHFSEAQILDLLLLAGWYHAISFAARAADIPLEHGAPRFNDFA